MTPKCGILVLGATLCLLGSARAQQAATYAVEGTNLDGGKYSGVAELRQDGRASFQVLWRIGSSTVEGIGMRSGHTFCVTYVMGKTVGIAIYDVGADGVMQGEWSLQGVDRVGTETLTPQ